MVTKGYYKRYDKKAFTINGMVRKGLLINGMVRKGFYKRDDKKRFTINGMVKKGY